MLGNKLLILSLLLITPASSVELDLASFENAEIIWLGSAGGQLEPLAEELVQAASGSGEIEFFKKDGEQVMAREVWALVDRERLLQKEWDYAIAEKELKYQLSGLDEKYKSEAKKHEEVVKKLEQEIMELSLSKRLPEASELAEEIDAGIASLKKDLAEANLSFERNFNVEKLEFEREKLRQALEKKHFELGLFREEKQYKASVSGRLNYLLPKVRFFQDSNTKAKFKVGDQIAIIRNDSEMLVVIPKASFPAPLQAGKSYLARVRTESGISFSAHYHDEVMRQDNGKTNSYYRFRVSDVDLPYVRSQSGQKVIANISEKFKQRAYIIPKADILHLDAELVQTKGWAGAALTLWPGYELVSEGLGSLALVKKRVKKLQGKKNER